MGSDGFRLGPGGRYRPQILLRPPKFLIGSIIVISLSRCCLPNDEGPGPSNIFPRTATENGSKKWEGVTRSHSSIEKSLFWGIEKRILVPYPALMMNVQ